MGKYKTCKDSQDDGLMARDSKNVAEKFKSHYKNICTCSQARKY